MMPIHNICPECHNTIESIDYDEEDCVIYCTRCGLVLAATIEYVAGEKIILPWGLL